MPKGSCCGGVALHISMYMLLRYVCTSAFFCFFFSCCVSHSCSISALWLSCFASSPPVTTESFQGVAERQKGGAQVKQIERVIVECLGFFCSGAFAVNAPSPQASLPPDTALPLLPHFILPSLWVEPAQSCQCASLCQPNYCTHLKGGKSSWELPGGAFPLWV